MTISAERAGAADYQAAFTSAIYGVVSIAAVVVTWEADGNDWHLAEVIAGYVVMLWLTHSYAAFVASGRFRSWWHVMREEFPVAAAGLPALAIALLGQLLTWSEERTSDLALIACAVVLVTLQANVVRRAGANPRRIILTVLLDMVLAAVIISLHIIF